MSLIFLGWSKSCKIVVGGLLVWNHFLSSFAASGWTPKQTAWRSWCPSARSLLQQVSWTLATLWFEWREGSNLELQHTLLYFLAVVVQVMLKTSLKLQIAGPSAFYYTWSDSTWFTLVHPDFTWWPALQSVVSFASYCFSPNTFWEPRWQIYWFPDMSIFLLKLTDYFKKCHGESGTGLWHAVGI